MSAIWEVLFGRRRASSPSAPSVAPAPATIVVVVSNPRGAPVQGAEVRLDERPEPYRGPTDASGRAVFRGVSPGPRHLWVSHDEYEPADRHVDAAPGAEVTIEMRLRRRIPRSPNALVGPLRLAGGAYVDDTGPVLPVGCHAGDLLALWARDPEWATAELDDIASAGYHGVRTWTWLEGPYWERLGRAISPRAAAYWDAVASFAAALRARGLRWIVSQGDLMRGLPGWDARRSFMRELAGVLREAGALEVVLAVDAGNEAWQNGEDDPAALRDALDAFRAELDAPVWSLTSPQGEEPEELARYAGSVYDVHGARHGHLSDKLRHAFSVGYEAAGRAGVPRLGIQSEPPGPGALVSVTEHQEELDDEGCVLLAGMHLLARQATVYFSSPGVSVRERGEFSRSPGFARVPELLDLLPRDLMTWPVLIHGGERWRGVRVWRAEGTTRVDQAISGDGRVVAVAYAPDGPPLLRAERAVTIDRMVGEGSTRGTVILGHL
jgi:hypothetical protein